ncbi:MAG: flagellar basal body L-ring protein FlgH [Pseudomonadota bacterium]
MSDRWQQGARLLSAGLLGAPLMGLVGCASTSSDDMPAWPSAPPTQIVAPAVAESGAIYTSGQDIRFFEDVKARRVGDMITITLAERTDARKSASTATSRESELDIPAPTIAGGPVPRTGTQFLQNDIDTSRAFSGSGDSSQSNSLNGSITVTVVGVTPTGNLLVHGEKWIEINQGSELLRISGLVRPADIQTDNSVESFRVANARITYSGRGAVARANAQGWLGRLFDSPLFPL